MSEVGGEAGGVDAAGENKYVTPRAGLQCVLKPRGPHTQHQDGALNSLKHILDSVPFTPSQGVRTPSPRHCMEAPQGNPFFSDDASSPPDMQPNRCVSPEPSWNVGAIAKQDAPVRGLPQHNSPLARYRETALCGQALQTPTSQSQASTQSNSPHKVAQPDMCGASAAAHMHPAWHGHQPHGNEQGHMPFAHAPGQGMGQGMYPPEDFRGPAYQMPMPHGMYGVPTDPAAMYVRPLQPLPHQHRPPGLAAMPTVPDVRQPIITRTANTNARGPTSPQRTHGNQVRKEGSNRQQSSSPNPDNRAKPGRKSMDSGAVKVTANAGQPFPSYFRDSDAVSSLSTDSPGPDSPNVGKSKIEVKLSSTGQLVFNARQRRTLRRALQRERRVAIPDDMDFSLEEPLTEAERAVVVDVVQAHIGCPLPETTDLDELMKVVMSLGVPEPEVVPEVVQEEQLTNPAGQPNDPVDQPCDPMAEPSKPTTEPSNPTVLSTIL